MEEKIFIGKLFESHKMINSPVSYLPELLQKFFSGEIDETIFKREFLSNTRRAKVCLSLMSKDIIKANKIIFRNEFILADEINFAIVEYNLSGQKFKSSLEEYIKRYNLANEETVDE